MVYREHIRVLYSCVKNTCACCCFFYFSSEHIRVLLFFFISSEHIRVLRGFGYRTHTRANYTGLQNTKAHKSTHLAHILFSLIFHLLISMK